MFAPSPKWQTLFNKAQLWVKQSSPPSRAAAFSTSAIRPTRPRDVVLLMSAVRKNCPLASMTDMKAEAAVIAKRVTFSVLPTRHHGPRILQSCRYDPEILARRLLPVAPVA